MEHKLIKWIATSVMLAIMSIGTIHAQSPFAGGTGTKADPFLIETPAQLDSVRNHLAAHFALGNDLDMAGRNVWIPIGTTEAAPFTGSFDGRGHVIRNLDGTTADGITIIGNGAGLFGWVMPADNGVAIRNLGVVNANITGTGTFTGALVGDLRMGTIFNCWVDNSSVTGAGQVGGLVGRSRSGMILRSWTNCTVMSSGTTSIVGGLVGMATNNGTISGVVTPGSLIENCYTLGYVEAGTMQAAGIAGSAVQGSIISNSYSAATIYAKAGHASLPISTSGLAAGIAAGFSQAGTTIRNSVSLSPSIKGLSVRRITEPAAVNDTNLRNNYALGTTELIVISVSSTSPVLTPITDIPWDSLTGRNGQSITLAQASLEATYTTSPFNWNFTNVWQIVGNTDFPTHREVPAVTSVAIDSTIEVGIGLTGALTWKVSPPEADPTVWFASLDEEIATIDNAGIVTGTGIGEVRIVIYAGNQTDTIPVTISPSPMEKIEFTVEELTIQQGVPDTLRWIRTPSATNPMVTLVSLDTTIVTVIVQNNGTANARGIVTGVETGTARVVVRSTPGGDDDTLRTDTVNIIVREADVTSVRFTNRTVGEEAVKGYTVQLRWTVLPAQAWQGVTFKSLDEEIVTVDTAGVVTGVGVGEGKVEITAGRAVVGGRDTVFKDTITITVHEMLITEGTGTRVDPFIIKTPVELNQVRQFLGYHFLLGNDLDMTDVDFRSIGTEAAPFIGSFDGDGNVIRNLTIDDSIVGVGLFGWVVPANTIDSVAIQNLGLVDANIRNRLTGAASSTGSLVGRINNGTIFNCFADNSQITGAGGQVGGLIGNMQSSSLIQSWANCSVVGTSTAIGALVGNLTHFSAAAARALIENCYALGHVRGGNFSAGLVGMVSQASVIRNSYTAATVVSTGATAAGIAASFSQGSSLSTSFSASPSVTATTTSVRIANILAADTLSRLKDNRALATTQLIIGTTVQDSIPRQGEDSINGLSVPMVVFQTQASYTTDPWAWDFTDTWKMNPGGTRLPIFIWQQGDDPSSILPFLPTPMAKVEASVFPNPTRGDLKVEVKDDVNIQQILVYSMTGQLVFSTTKPEFNIEKLRNGFYIIHVITDRGNFVSRIVKM
jgi:hypothetical protein